MVELTVGYVAGFIAAGMFLARIWSPNILTLILSGLLKDKNTAATWSIAGRALHQSNWPAILRSEVVLNHGVRTDVLWVTRFITLMSVIIAIAGVVTPLGLYQALVESDTVRVNFQYLVDSSPFGIGTPSRTNLSSTFNRACSGMTSIRPCPFTDTVAVGVQDDTGRGSYDFPYGYDTNIPKSLREIYSSGVGVDTTVSNYFDIQWRRYVTTTKTQGIEYNNGSSFAVGAFRRYETLALRNAYVPVEGLIVDTVDGGIGFRNHTNPPGFNHGVSWTEDILFAEPDTVCVDTNITLDFDVAETRNQSFSVTNLVLTDRGGFANINQTYPYYNRTDPQANPDLWGRAYKAAWLVNTYSMLYYNVTNPRNGTVKPFSYMNSKIGQTFPISGRLTTLDTYESFVIDDSWYQHLNLLAFSSNYSSSGGDVVKPPPNPFKITSRNFSDTSTICSGAGGQDYANVSNIMVRCGLMHGTPQRQTPGSNLIFDSGSKWSQPLYSCASAVKATIKTVTFSFNGTEENLKNLNVTKVVNKVYKDQQSKPLWGVEDTGNAYKMEQLSLLWGIVADGYATHPNVSTVRQESLYLPGWGAQGASAYKIMSDNLPGSNFYDSALGEAYNTGYDSDDRGSYSGGTNMAMWVRWQELSKSTSTAPRILNLIFSDFAAAAVVGTKGVLGPGNAGVQNAVSIPVTPSVVRIKYHVLFGIPAYIAAVGLILGSVAACIVVLFGHGSARTMRAHLKQTSVGRVFTTFLYPTPGGMTMASRDWSKLMGKRGVDLSTDYPMGVGEITQTPEKLDAQVSDSEVRPSEGESFLGQPSPVPGHSRIQSEGDIGSQGFQQPSSIPQQYPQQYTQQYPQQYPQQYSQQYPQQYPGPPGPPPTQNGDFRYQ